MSYHTVTQGQLLGLISYNPILCGGWKSDSTLLNLAAFPPSSLSLAHVGGPGGRVAGDTLELKRWGSILASLLPLILPVMSQPQKALSGCCK